MGHRRDNISQSDLRKWLIDRSHQSTRTKNDDSVTDYALSEQLTDRAPPASDFSSFIEALAGPSGVKASADGKAFSGPLDSDRERRVGPGRFGSERRTPVSGGSEAPSRYALFARAYTALRNDRYDEAAKEFDLLATYYNIESTHEWGFVLPYFARAASQSGDTVELEKFLDSKQAANEWGTHLAKAVFEAMHAHHDEALKLLQTSFTERPATGRWPVTTSYEYAETCVWLFEQTKDARYRQRALDWARAHAQIEPTHAWAYALIARFGNDEKERTQALAKALYLDQQSFWASQAPKELQASALAISKEQKFFRLRPPNAQPQHL